jgi:preprotein translocase subunit SecF
MRILKEANFQFMNSRKMGYIFSAVLIGLSIFSLILHGGPKYNIDFTGGTLVHLKFENNVQIQTIRSAVGDQGYGDSEIKHFGEENEIAIRTGIVQTGAEISTELEKLIEEALPDNPFVVQRVEKVGPKVGKELVRDALLAVFWAMVLILFYIMWRFEFKFSVGAIAALMHDVIITIGVFSVLDIEISAPIIAAVLTIVGYSLNDTIVVYDRIRENLKAGKKVASELQETVNRSINETLSRTVITSSTTLMVVTVLYFFGGEVLRTFALALIIGIFIGTYSSIFVASPIIVDWKTKKA